MSGARWDGDVMGRHSSGDFLTRLIVQKYESSKFPGAICCTLDGEWGAGKSFFIRNWSQDLKSHNHAVIHFDAWANDLSDEPLVGFISEIRKSITPYIKKAPKASQQHLLNLAKNFIKSAGDAIIPAGLSAAKGIAAKMVGKEAVEILSSDISTSDKEIGLDEAAEKATELFFEKALDNHSKKKKAIESLTSDLALLVEGLKDEGLIHLPIVICIDELDRCKPTYAIALLESTKHLLDAKGICFVYSTNIKQLSEAIKAVYGSGFDGHMYLKRFFDFEYRLPAPNNLAFSKYLTINSLVPETRILSGLPEIIAGNIRGFASQDFTLAKINTMFNLDLRSQKQVHGIFEAAALALPKGTLIHSAFLIILAALNHIDPTAFQKIVILRKGSLIDYLEEKGLKHETFHYTAFSPDGRSSEATISISQIFQFYLSATTHSARDMKAWVDAGDFHAELMQNLSHDDRQLMTRYPSLVLLAGLMET